MRKGNLTISLIILFVTVFPSCFVVKNKEVKKDESKIEAVAKKELSQTLKKIPTGQEKLYGFENESEIESAEVGTPFAIYTINNAQFIKTSSYRAPVVVAGEYRALATVEYLKDTYHIVNFGANTLAKDLQSVCEQNSKMNFVGILRIYSLSSDFVIMTNKGDSCFIPLNSAKKYLNAIGISNVQNYYSKSELGKFINK